MSELFPSLLQELTFWFVLLASILAAAWINRHRESPEMWKRSDNSDYLLISLGLVFGFVAAPILLGYARIGVLPNWLFYPGIALAILGDIVTFWASSHLGKFLSGHLRVRTDHSVIDKGPYRYLRHPMYTGELMAYVGLGLAVQSWVAILVILVLYGILYGNRIRIEERLLAAELGDDYVQYMKRTKRIIPFVF